MTAKKNQKSKSFFPAFLAACMLFISNALSAGDVNLKVKIPGAEGQKVFITTQTDFLSYSNIVLAESIVDSLGQFDVNLQLDHVVPVSIELNYYQLSFYLESGGDYALVADTADFENEFRPFYQKEQLGFTINEPKPGLNFQIEVFEKQFSEFVLSNYQGVRMNRNVMPVRNFIDELDSVNQNDPNSFLSLYQKYKLADLMLTINPSSKQRLFDGYVKDRFFYHHPVFMQFFTNYFQDHLLNNKFIKRIDLQSTINYKPDYFALTDSLGKDTLLRSEKLRDLVVLVSLGQFYYSEDFSRAGVLKVLDEMAEKSKFEMHRKMALNLRKELTHLQVGFEISNFDLEDVSGKREKLLEMNGKPIYIGFLTTSSFAGLGEYELIDSLYRELGSQVNFVTISLDENKPKWQNYMQDMDYCWKAYYNGTDWPMINYFRIKTFPVFLLLDPKGRVLQYPARKPSENIRFTLQRMVSEN